MSFLLVVLGVFFLTFAVAEQTEEHRRAIIHSSSSEEGFQAIFCSKPNFHGNCISWNDRVSSIQIPDFERIQLEYRRILLTSNDSNLPSNDSDLKQKVVLKFIGLLVTFGVAAILSQI